MTAAPERKTVASRNADRPRFIYLGGWLPGGGLPPAGGVPPAGGWLAGGLSPGFAFGSPPAGGWSGGGTFFVFTTQRRPAVKIRPYSSKLSARSIASFSTRSTRFL